MIWLPPKRENALPLRQRGFFLNSVRYASGPPTDPLFGQVALLMHMEGADNSTTFTDSSSSPKTVTPSGNARLSTTSPLQGLASGRFDGTNSTHLTIPAAQVPLLHATFWTIEFDWEQLGAAGNVAGRIFKVNTGDTGGPVEFSQGLNSANDNQILMAVTPEGQTAQLVGSYTCTTGVPIKVAGDWNGSVARFYVNGAVVGSFNVSALRSTLSPGKVRDWNIGGQTVDTPSRCANGRLDEFRVTTAARYQGAYTPITTAFPDQ